MPLLFSDITVTPVGRNRFRVSWATDAIANGSTVKYGISSSYGQQTEPKNEPGLLHSVEIGPLVVGRTYHIAVGNSAYSTPGPIFVSAGAVSAGAQALGANVMGGALVVPAPVSARGISTGAVVGGTNIDPLSLGSLRMRLRADDLTGFATNDPVGTWLDTSGQGNPVHQSSMTQQFSYSAALVNGRAALVADGIDDLMAGAPFASALAMPVTVIVVARVRDATLGNTQVFSGLTGADRDVVYVASGNWQLYTDPGPVLTGPAAVSNQWAVVSAIFDGASSSIKVNSVTGITGTLTASTLTGVLIGNDPGTSTPWEGDIAEVNLFAAHLTEGDEAGVIRFLGNYYGVTIS